MKYLNVGCGSHYSSEDEWTNLDFVSTGPNVIAHNLLNGIPFENNSFDLIYHSHVLEHFSKEEALEFMEECFRVLKPGGVIRVAIPDLERIAKKYLQFLEEGVQNPDDPVIRANYEWMLLEMYDQTVRNVSGGDMGKYLLQKTLVNESFIYERVGQEAKRIRKSIPASQPIAPSTSSNRVTGFREKISGKLKAFLLKRWNIDLKTMEIGKFRLEGEIHQWMYDRYSLTNLLRNSGGIEIKIRDAFNSYIPDWSKYNLDGKDSIVRKPDSLFIEAIKA